MTPSSSPSTASKADTPLSHSHSRKAFERACKLMPGGVNSPARAFGAVGGTPIFIERADGPYLYDLDGNRYIDYIASWGPMILGHAQHEVLSAIQSALLRGTSYGAPTEAESELAEQIIDAVPSIEKVRLVNSGTEATMSALRVARGATGRSKVIKFSGNYHGHVDALLVSAGSAAATLGAPDSPGVTPGAAADTLVASYNDVDQLRTIFAEHGNEIAAVILEPVVGNMGCVIPSDSFLRACRELTSQHGSILIFDEVMTGFRVDYGGAQSRLGVKPDMTTLGKIVGGGLPLGAYGGRADIMDNVLPAGKVFHAGTLSVNPLAVAAGIATLRSLKNDSPYEHLELMGSRLADGLRNAAKTAGIPHTVAQIGSMLTLFFNPDPVQCWRDADQCNRDQFSQYFWGLINEGVYMPCSQFEALFFTRHHTETIIDETIDAAARVLNRM